jgi:hypothetical protein
VVRISFLRFNAVSGSRPGPSPRSSRGWEQDRTGARPVPAFRRRFLPVRCMDCAAGPLSGGGVIVNGLIFGLFRVALFGILPTAFLGMIFAAVTLSIEDARAFCRGFLPGPVVRRRNHWNVLSCRTALHAHSLGMSSSFLLTRLYSLRSNKTIPRPWPAPSVNPICRAIFLPSGLTTGLSHL